MKIFTFVVTEEEGNLIIAALQEMPAKLANPLTNKLHEQARAQLQADTQIVEVQNG